MLFFSFLLVPTLIFAETGVTTEVIPAIEMSEVSAEQTAEEITEPESPVVQPSPLPVGDEIQSLGAGGSGLSDFGNKTVQSKFHMYIGDRTVSFGEN